ncbi:hypothetical protein HHL25_14160 [Rhizobium sp. S-51]|uniref:Uncharacterized protein n=1 Tax=Rhizobium terricola TaxID=2728849 RepID=A0A7Y0FWV9_9HYPH|nr:hypothetical protein [Rhizobium terricola]NML75271.1 hypothetical protein [Rhizobium terricola]
MTQYNISDVAIAIKEGEKVDDLSPIYWACRESAGIASMMALSLNDMIEGCVGEPQVSERLRDLEQAANLMRKRLDAVLDAIDHAEMRVRASIEAMEAPAADLARVAEAMQAAEGKAPSDRGQRTSRISGRIDTHIHQ